MLSAFVYIHTSLIPIDKLVLTIYENQLSACSSYGLLWINNHYIMITNSLVVFRNKTCYLMDFIFGLLIENILFNCLVQNQEIPKAMV